MTEHEPLKVFYSYSHEDEKYREDLEKHLSSLIRQNFIETWCDLRINPGANWRIQIINRIETSDIILFLVSADFLASDYCYSEEMERAIKRDTDGKARVIPIYVRPVYRPGLPFEKLLSLPFDARPVKSWALHDDAWVSVVEGIHRAINEINAKRNLGLPTSLFNNNTSRQGFSNISAPKTKFHHKPDSQENESSKATHQLNVTESNIDARAQRLKSIANRRDISREDADAAIEETESWLAEHEYDTNIRQIYLSLVEKKGTPIQVRKAIGTIEFWLNKNRNNTNVRAQYIILITQETDIEKANLVIKETENWINRNKKMDESVLLAYLGLIEKWGTIEQSQQAINNVENWRPTSSQTKRLKEKLSKLRNRIERVETGKHRQSTMREPIRLFEIAPFNIDRWAQELSRLAKEGALMECKAAIEETRRWLNEHQHREDTNIRQVYLKLVGKEGIDNMLVQKALEETETWLLEKKHDSNTSVRQAYLRLVRNRGTLLQQQKALKITEMWLKRYDSAHIRDAYYSLLQAVENFQGLTSTSIHE